MLEYNNHFKSVLIYWFEALWQKNQSIPLLIMGEGGACNGQSIEIPKRLITRNGTSEVIKIVLILNIQFLITQVPVEKHLIFAGC